MQLLFVQTVLSPWLIPVCILLSVAAAWFLYRNDKAFKDTPKNYIRLLSVLRFVSLFVILFFLLQPFVRLSHRAEEKPILLFAQDNSASLVMTDRSEYYRNDFLLRKESFLNEFREQAIIQSLSFGNKTSLSDNTNFSDGASDYDELIRYIRDTYTNRHVGALIIAGDGIINRGADPSLNEQGLWFPVYTIAMGDTTQRKDIAVREVLHNKVTYAGNRFSLKSYILATRCKGEKTVVTIRTGNEILYRKELQPASDQWVYELATDLPTGKAGLQKFTLSVSSVNGETNTGNNSQDFWLEVIESKRKILILFNAPHPDVGAIRLALSANGQYEIEAASASEQGKIIADYDVVILHQIPSKTNGATDLLKRITDAGKPVWFILGPQSNLPAFNSLNAGLKITSSGQVYDEALPAFQNGFSLFQWSETMPEFIATLPPLIAPYGEYNALFPQNAVLHQKIKNVTTSRPLMLFSDIPGQGKYAITAGEGMWRWRISCFTGYGDFALFDELVSRTVQYLSAGAQKERFIASVRKTYSENEAVTAGAELYDVNYKPDNRFDVFMNLTDSSGRTYEYVFARQGDFYRLSCGILAPGRWKWQAWVKAGEETFRKSGDFVVEKSRLENNDLAARHDVMLKLASSNNGFMASDTSFSQLADSLRLIPSMKPVTYSEYDMFDLIELYVILIALALLLATEWFFRKFLGSY